MKDLDQDYWDSRYKTQQTGWDMGTVSPPLAAYIDQLSDKNISILIPGCGNAYEAQYLLDKGFQRITLIDISPSLCEELAERWKGENRIQVVCADFFKMEGCYDLILEQTFFCAIHPDQRDAYVAKTQALLSTGGKLVGVLFDRSFAHEGPPFGGDAAEYLQRFKQVYSQVDIEPCYNSIGPRQGSEVFIRAKK